jgi:AraC-like DNA-binding protein
MFMRVSFRWSGEGANAAHRAAGRQSVSRRQATVLRSPGAATLRPVRLDTRSRLAAQCAAMTRLSPQADEAPPTGCFAGVEFARGRLFDTADLDEARDICGRVFNPHRLSLVGPGQSLRSRMDHLPIGPLSLNRLTWGARVRVDPDRLDSYGLISLPVRGSARFHVGGAQVEVSPRQACVIDAAQRFHFEADAQFDQIVLRFEHEALAQAWTALSGMPPPAELALQPGLPLAGSAWQALEPVLRMLAACARQAYAPSLLPHIQLRLQDLLLSTLLMQAAPALAPVASTAVPTAAAAVVRRAQAWLLARLTEPVSLGAAARASGVAARTLQAAFQSQCGMGPMQWLREQRLAAVHRRLREASGPTTRVTDTALAYGFSHLGEFSRAYRRRFGETPARTLARR